jgi:zinc protease
MNSTKLVSLTLGAVVLAATACNPEVPQNTISWVERRAELPNGMRVVIMPDSSTQLVQVDIRYEVGANEDPPGKAGLAHLVEHMMFQHRPLGADKPPTFQIIPQLTTFFNAYTIWDKTHYQLQAPKEDLEALLRLESFRMNAICQTIPPDEFEREREVVRNEIRQRGGTAEGLVDDILGKSLYPKGHPYSHTVGGDDKQLSNITFQDTCDFMTKYYVPERATLVIAGNVNEDAVGKMVAATFGGIAKRPPAPRVEVTPIELSAKTVEETLDIEKPTLMVAWKLPSMADDEWKNVDALRLGVGKIAGLAREYDDCIRNAGATDFGGNLAPTFVVFLELCDNDHFDEALAWVWKGAAGGSWGLKNAEFDEDSKNLAKQAFVENLESIGARTEWMADFLQFQRTKYTFTQDRQILFDELDRLDKVDASGFAAFAAKTFQKSKAVVIKIKASEKGLKGDTRSDLKFSAKTHDKDAVKPIVDPSEAQRPLPAPQGASLLAAAERYTLGNGLNVVLLPTQAPLPLVRASIVFGAGAVHESKAAAGLADVAASFLAPERDADFMKTGVFVRGGASDDATTFEAGGMSMYSDVIITALERVLKIGVYDQDRIERFQKEVRQQWESRQYREQRAFQEEQYAALFGVDHPYTVNGSPTKESVGKIGYDAATEFKRGHYEAKNATLVVTGSFDAKKIKGLIADTFGGWSGGDADKPIGPARAPRSGPIYKGVVTAKEGPQMEVSIAYPAPAGIDGQQATRQVMLEMLNTRLFQIRTELGSTYGTYARKTNNRGPNGYLMGGGVDAARAGESLKAMREKIEGLRQGENFDADFAQARRAVLKRLLAQSSDPTSLARRLTSIASFGLAPDYSDQQTKLTAAVSPAAVRALIKAELKPEDEIIVCKADRATLTKAFAEAGLDKFDLVEPK